MCHSRHLSLWAYKKKTWVWNYLFYFHIIIFFNKSVLMIYEWHIKYTTPILVPRQMTRHVIFVIFTSFLKHLFSNNRKYNKQNNYSVLIRATFAHFTSHIGVIIFQKKKTESYYFGRYDIHRFLIFFFLLSILSRFIITSSTRGNARTHKINSQFYQNELG